MAREGLVRETGAHDRYLERAAVRLAPIGTRVPGGAGAGPLRALRWIPELRMLCVCAAGTWGLVQPFQRCAGHGPARPAHASAQRLFLLERFFSFVESARRNTRARARSSRDGGHGGPLPPLLLLPLEKRRQEALETPFSALDSLKLLYTTRRRVLRALLAAAASQPAVAAPFEASGTLGSFSFAGSFNVAETPRAVEEDAVSLESEEEALLREDAGLDETTRSARVSRPESSTKAAVVEALDVVFAVKDELLLILVSDLSLRFSRVASRKTVNEESVSHLGCIALPHALSRLCWWAGCVPAGAQRGCRLCFLSGSRHRVSVLAVAPYSPQTSDETPRLPCTTFLDELAGHSDVVTDMLVLAQPQHVTQARAPSTPSTTRRPAQSIEDEESREQGVLVSCSMDRTIRLWELPARVCKCTLNAHKAIDAQRVTEPQRERERERGGSFREPKPALVSNARGFLEPALHRTCAARIIIIIISIIGESLWNYSRLERETRPELWFFSP